MHKFLFTAFLGFASGIFFHSFFDFGYWFSIFFLFLGVVLYILILNQYISSPSLDIQQTSGAIIFVLFLFSFGIGLLRYDISLLNDGDETLEKHIGENIMLRGVVSEEPDERENNTLLSVSIKSFFDKNIQKEINTKMLIIAPLFPKFQYGDKLEILGTLKKPENFSNSNGRLFDYVSYLKKDKIFYQMFQPNIKYISSGNGIYVKEKLFFFKNKFLESISALIPEPKASLAGGLIVGAKRSLGEKWLEAFRDTGVIHIVVLSGYNVTIVASAIARVFGFLPRFAGILLSVSSVVLFAIMTGASATIVRASIMALFVILAKAVGRLSEITTALFLAAFFMLLQNPHILVFDPSFQLSFLATLGLIYLAPNIEKYFHIISDKWGFRDVVIATIATQIFVLPFLLYQTGEFSLVSLPTNLLILVFVPATMLFGFLAGVIGFWSAILAAPFSFIANALLSYELKVVEIFAAMPFASVTIPRISFVFVLGIYAFFWFIIFKIIKK